MDPVTSAWVFVIGGLLSATLTSTFKNNVAASMIAILINTINAAQLAYFTGLWPIYILSAISLFMLLAVVLAAGYLAIKDANNAKDYS